MARNGELITYLREFEKSISRLPRELVSPVGIIVGNHLDYIFTNYIDVKTLTEKEVVEFMKVIHNHNINRRIGNLIMSRLLFELDIMDTYRSETLRVNIIQNQIVKVMR